MAGQSLIKTKGHGSGWIMVATGWGLAVTLAVYISGFFSPAHLNPALTIGFTAVGAMAASRVLWLHYYPHWEATEDSAAILGTFATAPAIRHTWSNVVGEIVGTAVLMIGVMALGPNEMANGFNPMVVGFIVASVGFSLGHTTGYAINPARDLGPRIMHAILPIANKGISDWRYSWIPVVGPIIGAALGAWLYNTVLVLI